MRGFGLEKKNCSSFFLLSSIIHNTAVRVGALAAPRHATPTEDPRHTGRKEVNLLDWPRSRKLAKEVKITVNRTATCYE